MKGAAADTITQMNKAGFPLPRRPESDAFSPFHKAEPNDPHNPELAGARTWARRNQHHTAPEHRPCGRDAASHSILGPKVPS
jgi:hypothetical protein